MTDQSREATHAAAPLRRGLSFLGSLTRPHRTTLAIGMLLGLLTTGVSLATPMATKWVLDSLAPGAELAAPLCLLVLLLLMGAVAGLAQLYLLGRLAEQVVLEARRSLVQRFFRAKLEQVQRFRTGELVTRVTSDTVLLRTAATSSVVQLINGLVSLIGTIVLMALLDWPLLIATLVAIVLIGGAFGALLPKIGAADKRAQDAIGELGASLEGGMRALRTVKASRAEAQEIGRVAGKAREAAGHSIRSVWYSALVWSIAGGGVQLSIIVILGLGAWRVSLGDLAVSSLVAFLLYAFNIVEPVSSLAEAFSSIQSGLAAAARIRETEHLEQEDTGVRPAGAPRAAPPNGAPALALRAVTAGYEGIERPALTDVSFEVPVAGHVALVGPSGAGKTTVFSLLLRFLEPRAGRLELHGVPYGGLSIDDVRSRIAYVEQETPVIPGTVRDNVLVRVGDASDAEVWRALEAVRLDERVRTLPAGLDSVVADTQLSGGERQRLAVARAIVRRPSILLLDEATAQLDGTTEAAIHRVIADIARTGAVVTIAHRLSTILDADTIIVLDRGRIRAVGTHHELLGIDELYRQFVEALRIAGPDA